MYKKVSSDLNFIEREKKISCFWHENEIFKKSIRNSEREFVFYEGPPTANGKPHIGHVLTRVMKDIIPRYKTMKGYKVERKAGWDTHGLPVELEVEKLLKINGKPEIEKYGVEDFVKKCKESVFKYQEEWEKLSDRIGFWIDLDNPYITYENSYIESVWWALKQIWDKGLIYKGHKIVPYCPRCGTALSSHEVAQGYKDVKEASIFVKFKVKNEENTYILAWTTTPWTLPSNVALTVNPEENYCKVRVGEEYYILAESLLQSIFDMECQVTEKKRGKELFGLEYEPLFDYAETEKKAFYVVYDNFVTLSDGTGVVHTAPAFGEDDAAVGRKFDLPFVQLVDEQGKFIDKAYDFKGMFVKDADSLIIKNLESRSLLFKVMNFEHSYPFCWRCDTHLLYYARDTWFIEVTKLKQNLIDNNNKINWYPDNIKEGRFGNFLENIIDWGISRERYWGTPLPIWECGCGQRHMIGSVEELKSMSISKIDEIELHKPYIDSVYLKCPKCGGSMKRVSEVIDCWFDSGSMPFAQIHYPFENKDNFKLPADFISEAVDQTRGWFYTLHAISTLLFDTPAYKNVIVLGHVQDKDGLKMSKHKGNVVDPWEILDDSGADAVRWYFYINSAPWLPSRFYKEAVQDAKRKFMGTLWNTYAFFVLYANIDDFSPLKYPFNYDDTTVIDKWILSKLNTLVKTIENNLDNYKITESGRALQEFIEELSNWYIRRSRERFWAAGMEKDKVAVYNTLYIVLETVTKLIAPFVPFIAEEIYQNLVRSVNDSAPVSVHLCDFPVCNESYIDSVLEDNMDSLLKIVNLGRACRNKSNIKNRQPLSKIYVKSEKNVPEVFRNLICEELNIKEIEFTAEGEFTEYKFKPQLKVLGPRYGKLVPKIGEYLKNVDGNKVWNILKTEGFYEFELEGQTIKLEEADLLIEAADKENIACETWGGLTVALDTKLSEELISEGFTREIISKIQNMRKEADFEILDNIYVYYEGEEKIRGIIEANKDMICKEVLAKSVSCINAESKGFSKEWNINGEKLKLIVLRV